MTDDTIYQGLNSFAACFGGFIFGLPVKLSVMCFHRLRLIPDDDILKGKLHGRLMHSKKNTINYPVCRSTRSTSFLIAAGFVCYLDLRIFNRCFKFQHRLITVALIQSLSLSSSLALYSIGYVYVMKNKAEHANLKRS